jgi:hypothetical protein
VNWYRRGIDAVEIDSTFILFSGETSFRFSGYVMCRLVWCALSATVSYDIKGGVWCAPSARCALSGTVSYDIKGGVWCAPSARCALSASVSYDIKGGVWYAVNPTGIIRHSFSDIIISYILTPF